MCYGYAPIAQPSMTFYNLTILINFGKMNPKGGQDEIPPPPGKINE